MSFSCFVGCLALTSTMSQNVIYRIRPAALATRILLVTMIRTQALVAAMKIVTLVMTTMIMAIHNRMTIFHDEQDDFDIMDDDF